MKDKTVKVELNKSEFSFLLEAIAEYGLKYSDSKSVQDKINAIEDKLYVGVEQMCKLLKK